MKNQPICHDPLNTWDNRQQSISITKQSKAKKKDPLTRRKCLHNTEQKTARAAHHQHRPVPPDAEITELRASVPCPHRLPRLASPPARIRSQPWLDHQSALLCITRPCCPWFKPTTTLNPLLSIQRPHAHLHVYKPSLLPHWLVRDIRKR